MATSVKVGVSNVNLRLNVVYVAPYTEVNYIIPAASITYVGLQVGAELDITNRNPYVIETVFAVDDSHLGVGKNFFEELPPATDAVLGFGVTKGIADPISFSDNTTFSNGFIRQYTDTFSLIEALGFTHTKLLADSVTMTDDLRKAFGMLRQDNAIMFDQTDVFDGLEYSFGKGLTDSVSPASSGSLYMTDYCDITYFAEDYVGTSLTFT